MEEDKHRVQSGGPKYKVLQNTEAVVGYGEGTASPRAVSISRSCNSILLGGPFPQARSSSGETDLPLLRGWQVT